MATQYDPAALIRDYTPVLVLYPEIGSTLESLTRKRNPDFPHESPLQYDYHPRDIKLVLENASLHRRFRLGEGRTSDWVQMLDRMEEAGYDDHLDIVPGVDHIDRESFWKAYADIPKDNAKYERACYARVIPGRGNRSDRVVAQYWYPYFYNDFWNTHEMDWEAVMIVFKFVAGVPRPTICAYSAHLGGHWLPWSQVGKADATPVRVADGTHPIVYVANGSHASYFYGSGVFSTAPPLATMAADLLKENRRLVDYTISWEEATPLQVEARLIPESRGGVWDGEWRWLNHRGRWGAPGRWLDLEFGDSGPHGPAQSGDKWEFPFHWIDTSCTRAPSYEESRGPTAMGPE